MCGIPPHRLRFFYLVYKKQGNFWLKWQEMLQGLDVVRAPNTLPDLPLADASQNVSLVEANVHHGENDKVLKALSDLFWTHRSFRHDPAANQA